MELKLTVNGVSHSDEVEPRLLLIHYLRETCGLRAANVGCDTTSCGACTVLLDGESVKSCTVLAVQANGRSVTTAEGLVAPDGTMSAVQQAFREQHGARAAGRGVAADVRGAEAADLPQVVHEQQPRLDLVAARDPVDGQLEIHSGLL